MPTSQMRSVAVCLGFFVQLAAAAGSDRLGRFEPHCAKLDLEVIGFIEWHGEKNDLSQDELGKIGLQFLEARMACLEGRAERGADIYTQILRTRSASTRE
jgi:hypothetical protein